MRKWISAVACMLVSNIAMAQKSSQLYGYVTTSDGFAAEAVTVTIKETGSTAFTDNKGYFIFRHLPNGKYTLTYSYAEMKPQTVQVTVPPENGAATTYQLPFNEQELQQVIITTTRPGSRAVAGAGKAGIAIMDMPQAVTIINQATIENQQAQRLSDVIKNVNGVYLGSARAATQETFYARGYNLGSTNTFKNGFRVNSGAMPEMSALQSVEVLKGSAAILYGNVAPGGIINMVTKKPLFNFGGEVSLRAGSYGLVKPAVDVYGPLSKNIAYRLNADYETAKSYRDVVHSERFYINPSLLFILGKKTNFLLQGDYLKHDFTPDFGIGSLNNTLVAPVPRSRFMGAGWQYAHTRQATANMEFNHRFNDQWQLAAGAAYQNYSRDYYSIERIQADAAGKWKRPLGKYNNKEDYYSAQINLHGRLHTGSVAHQLLVGTDAEKYMQVNLSADITGKIYDSINILDPALYVRRTDIPAAKWVTNAKVPVTRWGAYAQDLISITKQLKLLAGVRWSLQDAAPAQTAYLLYTDSLTKGKRQVDRAFSPRAGLVYQPNTATSFFISYANSFTPNTGTDIYNNAIKPSIIDQYELGVKKDFLQGKISTGITGYKIINNNLAQMAQTDKNGKPNTNTGIKELTGQTTSTGVEVDIKGHIINALDITGGYSYNNMRYTKTTGKSGSYVTGERLVNSPAHTASLTAFYTFTNNALKNLKLGAGVYYTGDRFGGWNNVYTDNNGTKSNRLIAVKGFTTLDFSAGYCYKKISLLGKVSNITNTYSYYIHENYSINPIAPRSVIFTLAYKW